MSIVNTPSAEFVLNLTEEERSQLLNWLEQKQRNTLVEEHRTDSPKYKDYVLHKEEILEKLINKLRPS